ncbi:unnamed protein product [Parnassius apollo]|uniref:(apollo) hypothetical protein n=1 Tax=Parnassius apollo TaxID=110799 RepID=A0A8S3XEG7_PARAO|nr:unnamed protein product [Parnassius apollo]
MQVIKETPELNASIDQVKNNVVIEETVECVGPDVVHKSNGVVDIRKAVLAEEDNVIRDMVVTQESVEWIEENNEVTVATNEAETSQKIAAVQGPDTKARNENISSSGQQEVLNKEELLDISQIIDVESSDKEVVE